MRAHASLQEGGTALEKQSSSREQRVLSRSSSLRFACMLQGYDNWGSMATGKGMRRWIELCAKARVEVVKRRVLTPSLSFAVSCSKACQWAQGRSPEPFQVHRGAATQEEAIGAGPQLVLHGRKVPRMLQHHHRLLPRPNCRSLRIMLYCPLPAYRW